MMNGMIIVFKRFKWISIIASFHGIENMQTFSSGSDLADQVIYFASRLTPNPPSGKGNPTWPKYTKEGRRVYVYTDNPFEARKVGSDGYRRDRMEVLTQVLLDSPV